MNNTTDATDTTKQKYTSDYKSLKYVIDLVLLGLAFLTNLLLITSIIRTKNLRNSSTNILVLNLSLCCFMIATVTMYDTAAIVGHLPLGNAGCKIVNPLKTIGLISSVFTMVLFSCDRYVAIVYQFKYQYLKRHTFKAIIAGHAISLICVVPYAYHMKEMTNAHDVRCYESWSYESFGAYTIFLFVIQYALPLPVIIYLYAFSWLRLKQQNNEFVQAAKHRKQDNLSLINKLNSSCVKSTTDNCKRGKFRITFQFGKHKFKQQLSVVSKLTESRERQTIILLKSFIYVTSVFAVSQLPIQISWFLDSYAETDISQMSDNVLVWLAYASYAVTPIIYGIIPKFRKAYIRQFRSFVTCCHNASKFAATIKVNKSRLVEENLE